MEKYDLKPAPYIIELDKRCKSPFAFPFPLPARKSLTHFSVADFGHIQTLLKSITGRRTVPNVILDFVSIGGSDEITLLHAEGGLKRRFEEMRLITSWRRRVQAVRPPIVAPPVEERDLVDADEDDFPLPVQKRTPKEPPYESIGADLKAPLSEYQQYELVDDLVSRNFDSDQEGPAARDLEPVERTIQTAARGSLPGIIALNPRQVKANGAIALVAAAKMRRTRVSPVFAT